MPKLRVHRLANSPRTRAHRTSSPDTEAFSKRTEEHCDDKNVRFKRSGTALALRVDFFHGTQL